MDLIKNVFTISDLENISGIKAHTIRIWEKRYNIFNPERVTRNIRHYNIEQLQKLLNVAMLRNQGWKISHIAALSEKELIENTKTLIDCKINIENVCKELKVAMYTFDSNIFEKNYQEVIDTYSFTQVYHEVFAPLLRFIGLLWQTQSITPAHEHFISNLIVQKILLKTSLLNSHTTTSDKPTFVLYLPEEEMHEVSLLYLNYELKLREYNTVYIGRSIPLKALEQLKVVFPLINWVSIFTMNPTTKHRLAYLEQVQLFLENHPHQYWAIGQNLTEINELKDFTKMKFFLTVKDVLTHLDRD